VARGRMINKKISLNKAVNDLSSDTSRLAFTWAIAHLDASGRISGDPRALKSTIFPRREGITVKLFQSFIEEWVSGGLVIWYEADGDKWLQFNKFRENQPGLRPEREKDSPIPSPEEGRSLSGVNPETLPHKLSEVKLSEEKIARRGDSPESLSLKPISFSADDAALYTSIKVRFEKEQPQHRFTNYKKEGQSIKWLIEKARARDPDSPDVFLEGMIRMFEYLRSIDKFFKGQPFLPSALNASAIWDRVLSAAQERFKEEQAAIKYDDISEVQF